MIVLTTRRLLGETIPANKLVFEAICESGLSGVTEIGKLLHSSMLGGLGKIQGYITTILFQVCMYNLIQSITTIRLYTNPLPPFIFACNFFSVAIICLPTDSLPN